MQNNHYVPLNTQNTVTHSLANVNLSSYTYNSFTVTTAGLVVNGATYPTVGVHVINTLVESVGGGGGGNFNGRPIGYSWTQTGATSGDMFQPTIMGMGGVNN